MLFEIGPFSSEDDWMEKHLGVHPRAVIRRLRMLRLANGPSLELFEYSSPDQDHARPRNSDAGGHHLAFYVTDMAAAVDHLKRAWREDPGRPNDDDRWRERRSDLGLFPRPLGLAT